MRTSLRLGLAACLLLMVFWITSEIRGLNSRWMPIDDANLVSPSKTTPEPGRNDDGKPNLIEIGSYSDLPSPGEPITSPVRHGLSKETDAPGGKPKTHDPTELPEDKILVMGKMKKQNTDWVEKNLPNWQHAIYTLDDRSTHLHTSTKKGNEANAFLTFIIDNYNHLPGTIAFIHPNRNPDIGQPVGKKGKNNKKPQGPGFDNVESLRRLNLEYVQRQGYANLRCAPTPGCPDAIQPFRNNTEQTEIDHTMATVWGQFFDSQEVPDVIGTPRSGQFVVSKNQVRERPLDDYIKFQEWLVETPLEDSVSTEIFEYLWHIIFGKDAVHCPPKDKCMKDLYPKKKKGKET